MSKPHTFSKKTNNIKVNVRNISSNKKNTKPVKSANETMTLAKLIKLHSITHVHISYSLKHFEKRFLELFKLENYKNKKHKDKNTLFFGYYDKNDFSYIKEHYGNIFLMFGGTDLTNNFKYVQKHNRKLNYVAISKNIFGRLKEKTENIQSIWNVEFNMVDKTIFKPSKQQGSAIYVYDGYISKPQNEYIYNIKLINEVKKIFPGINFIHSSKIRTSYHEMPDIYKKCFIGMRLTNNDGNANTVQEMEAMNIPIIHNQSDYGLKWKSITDIVSHINNYIPSNLVKEKITLEQLLKQEKIKKKEEAKQKAEEAKQKAEEAKQKAEEAKQKAEEAKQKAEEAKQKEKEDYNSSLKSIEHVEKYDFFELSKIDNKTLQNINNNIELFNNLVKPYKKILFICTDYPGFGGAATNCYELQKYYTKRGHICYGFYYNYNTDNKSKKYYDYQVGNINDIKKIKFKPDLIILKSFVTYDLKSFNCPSYYLVGGIYLNTLNKYYYDIESKEEQDIYVNTYVIKQIEKSTMTFVNSSHTQKILKKYYNLKSNLFYSSFIPFQNTEIVRESNSKFSKRKYSFGLIASDFNRPIKNIEKSIEFLKKYKHKDTIILIGKNSKKYKNLGFTCVDLVSHSNMKNYYKQIKYVIQDSFYESCSNVKIESLLNGCIFRSNIQIKALKPFQDYKLENNVYYVIGNFEQEDLNNFINISYYNTYYEDYSKFFDDYFDTNNYNGYIVHHNNCSSIALLVYVDAPIKISYNSMLEKAQIYDECIITNNEKFETNDLINLYYKYGECNIPKKTLGLSLFYDSYISNKKRNYNKELYILTMSYYYGVKKLDIINLLPEFTKNIFHKESILIFNKLITGYGGVQKTGYQLLNMFEKHYNIVLVSNNSIGKSYSYNIKLNNDIPQPFVQKISTEEDITNMINNNNYKFIINNKLNDILNYNINKKMHVICHNSNDPFNNIIIENKDKVQTIFTINQFHKNLLIANNIESNIVLYRNFVNTTLDNNVDIIRSKFNYNIAYIGRISQEKNIQSLIDGVNKYNDLHDQKITLYIIGSGSSDYNLENVNENIILVGYLPFSQIIKYYQKVDYVISNSLTEGRPFSIIEAQIYGIPCIHSNINGIDEIIFNNVNGFLYNIRDYATFNTNMNFDKIQEICQQNLSNRIKEVLHKAYSISVSEWQAMSDKCLEYTKHIYEKDICIQENFTAITENNDNNNIDNSIENSDNMNRVFINFKPNINLPYGGGNLASYNIINYFNNYYKDFTLTYNLKSNIKIYLIIDPFKDGKFKKHNLEEVIEHRNGTNQDGKIVLRVNDCDITRDLDIIHNSRETSILENFENIDFFIFNSNFIKNYYIDLFEKHNKNMTDFDAKTTVIHNGGDFQIFKNKEKNINLDSGSKVKIVTHHWSNNINKGYQTYLDLWRYTQDNDVNFEFIFIGKNVPEMFADVPIHGPFVKDRLSDELNENHIYITDSRYDSCPNHVIEAILCGLPILYSNQPGGAKELCTLTEYKIGEIYNDFDELLEKIALITKNYDEYRQNLEKAASHYYLDKSIKLYCHSLLNQIYKTNNYKVLFDKNTVVLTNHTASGYVIINKKLVRLMNGINVFAFKKEDPEITIMCNNYSYKIYEFTKMKKLNNNSTNILFCSDANYYVGLFACLNSVIQNSLYVDNAQFNFIVKIDDKNDFPNILTNFERKVKKRINKTIIYIDENILDPIFFETSCYKSGGHLLNVGNLSRLLIGEFMAYKKLLYLDSDSIVQYDIIKKLLNFNLKSDLYAKCANVANRSKNKEIIIKMKNILNESILDKQEELQGIVDTKINMEDYAFMGAPFLTNCTKWKDVYRKTIELIKIQNATENGIYNLFTMSIQNLLFYKKTRDINEIFNVLQDLGSKRKNWDKSDILNKYVLDWSGIYKPWYTNGLYRNYWLYYDVMNLSENYKAVFNKKNIVEKFSS